MGSDVTVPYQHNCFGHQHDNERELEKLIFLFWVVTVQCFLPELLV